MRLILWALPFLFSTLIARPLQLDVFARNAILINAETGAILYEKEAHVPVYPASTTKVATALFALKEKGVDLGKLVTASPEALRMKTAKNRNEVPPHFLESDGTNMGLVKGEVLTYESLFHGLMLVSANDAANVIAESLSGSVEAFMKELNEYLKKIGCLKTTFYTPHGYHAENHFTTAYDLSIMAKFALEIPAFRSIVAKESYLRPKTNKRPQEELRQFNKLMVKTSPHYYPKAIGVKTGYYKLAGSNLVAAAVDNGRTLIAVILGGENRAKTLTDARNLFEAAFREKQMTRILVPAMKTYAKALDGAKNELQAILVEDLVYSYYPAEESEIKAFVHWENLNLPIPKGAKVGQIRAFGANHTMVATRDIYAREEVEPTFFFVLREKWNEFISHFR